MVKDFEEFKTLLIDQLTDEWELQVFNDLRPVLEKKAKGESTETQVLLMSRAFAFHLSLEMLKLYHQWMQED